MEHDNQPIPTALLSKEGPKEFNTTLNEHGEQVVFTSYQQVLAVAISWSTTSMQ